ncbi:glycerol-3-phosphate 1-O-acyltransferase PlsY [Microvirga sp. STR05]|uniref:Glycerol-3-phosphate acyltransferase n=2 Tax=Hymenobacter TaxID=89966 RepID=A0A7G7W8S0_9BACT|nr:MULTISPECIES: glycerol-3-phosphate 1-O-acyltransferase PlsY [Hymenobacter]MBD2714274.1 glycerol-3-phosphate 1-O-acyltransferase PlsY [Hymenobacter duratus]MBR7949177.1 glycerol-3-phosphate 1-O-acyltransferase PlsY [Microvirga sp. STR05]QNH62763.1 glycerol-3-phosphate 1-O-acyltransferase PlsY [Hymenobacter sediminicola]
MNIPIILGLLVAAYLLGSIPTALWVGQRFFGLDIREHGSGNAGATNTFRVLGKKPGSFVMAIDVLKGWAATSLAQVMLNQGAIEAGQLLYFQLACGILAILGHIYPVFAGFRGGKGVATVLGMMLAIAPATVGVCILVFLAVLATTQYVSLSSMTAGVAFALLQLLPAFRPQNQLLVWFGFILAALLIYTHRANIGRLRAGTESRVPLPWKRK